MSALLTTASVMHCPHLGTVQPQTKNNRVRFAGTAALRETDSFPIVGCIFSTSSGSHPCVRVEWQSTALRSTVLGDATLTEDSVGFCYAADKALQGTVQIGDAPPRVAGI
jgi:hypothetical protein